MAAAIDLSQKKLLFNLLLICITFKTNNLTYEGHTFATQRF